MLTPKKVKYRKWQTGRTDMTKVTPDTRGNQIESARKVTSRTLGKTGRMWIRIFPDRPFTAKPAEVGMGKGKGDPQGYCLDIRPGRVIFEVDGVSEAVAKESLRKAGTKLPIKTRVVTR